MTANIDKTRQDKTRQDKTNNPALILFSNTILNILKKVMVFNHGFFLFCVKKI
jgi:hypothetical protein